MRLKQRRTSDSWLKQHSLSIVLTTIFLSFTGATIILGRPVYTAEELHIGFWQWWAYEYTMSLVADNWGALALVVLTKFLFERGSAESNDGGE